MISEFGGAINLIVFLALTVGWAYYAYQMLFTTKAFFDRFNISHTGVIMGGFVGSFAAAVFALHIVLLFNGISGAWILFTFVVVQGLIAALASFFTIQSQVGVSEGVKYTMEPVIAPLVFVAGYSYLLWSMSDIVYGG